MFMKVSFSNEKPIYSSEAQNYLPGIEVNHPFSEALLWRFWFLHWIFAVAI